MNPDARTGRILLLPAIVLLWPPAALVAGDGPVVGMMLSSGDEIRGEALSFTARTLTIRSKKGIRRVYWPNIIAMGLQDAEPKPAGKAAAALSCGRAFLEAGMNDIAACFFVLAVRKDGSLKGEIAALYDNRGAALPKSLGGTSVAGEKLIAAKHNYARPGPGQVRASLNLAREWGQKARDIVPAMHLIETPHFLIYSAWSARDDNVLKMKYEKLYRALCRRFKIDYRENIWIGKLPVYAFWRQDNFVKFSALVTGVPPEVALRAGGYAGYKKQGSAVFRFVALGAVWRGRMTRAMAQTRFYEVLVHESTHAFMGRYINERRIPNWVDEGIAETMAATLVPQSHAARKIKVLTKLAAGSGAPVESIFDVGNIPMSRLHYGMAQSLVRYLYQKNSAAFIAFIEKLKEGVSDRDALQSTYNISREKLVREWKAAALRIR